MAVGKEQEQRQLGASRRTQGKNEDINAAASREVYEETGSVKYELEAVRFQTLLT